MGYPDVKQGHIVPATYLKAWTIGGKLVMRLVSAKDASYPKSPKKVGTRNRAYRRTRPGTGEKIDDVEASLQALEDRVSPLLHAFVERPEWPLPTEKKKKLAEFFAMQALRGADGQAWLEKLTRDFHAKIGLKRPIDTDKLTMMLKLSRSVTAWLCSMQWLLLEFDAPLLTTSDEPVVIWPLDANSRKATDLAPHFEFQPLLEIQIPVSPRLAIVMTWVHDSDKRFPGNRDLAATLNALVIGQADHEWYHRPGVDDIPRASGSVGPISPQLMPGYGPFVVEHSKLRKTAMAYVLKTLNRPLDDTTIEVAVIKEAQT